jgi:hypothetical protein
VCGKDTHPQLPLVRLHPLRRGRLVGVEYGCGRERGGTERVEEAVGSRLWVGSGFAWLGCWDEGD